MPLDPQLKPLVDAMAANPDAKAIQEQTPKEARDGYRALASMFGPGATQRASHCPQCSALL